MGDVEEGAEWARSKQRIAGAPEEARLLVMGFGEVLDKRSLSDSRLAAYKHKAAIARDYVAEYGFQFAQELFAFEQFHSLLIAGPKNPVDSFRLHAPIYTRLDDTSLVKYCGTSREHQD